MVLEDVMGGIVLLTTEGVAGIILLVMEETVGGVMLEDGIIIEDVAVDIATTSVDDLAGFTTLVDGVVGIILLVMEEGVDGVMLEDGIPIEGVAGFILLDVTSCCMNGAKCLTTLVAAKHSTLS